MSDLNKMLREFHYRFHCNVAEAPSLPSERQGQLYVALQVEETDELAEAVRARDIVAVADALADIVYVAYGTALTYGIPLDEVLEEVHRSNMSKLGPNLVPIFRDDGKVLKGPDYSPPDIAKVLAAGRSTSMSESPLRQQIAEAIHESFDEWKRGYAPLSDGPQMPDHVADAVLALLNLTEERRETPNLGEWTPDCGGDWCLSGSRWFANYWPDKTVSASIYAAEEGDAPALATSGIMSGESRADCQRKAEEWIRAQLLTLPPAVPNGYVVVPRHLLDGLLAATDMSSPYSSRLAAAAAVVEAVGPTT